MTTLRASSPEDDYETPLLEGVEETLLLPLFSRAAEQHRKKPLIRDALANEISNRFTASSVERYRNPSRAGALRSARVDAYLFEFLRKNPSCNVVSLGEGLETQLWRMADVAKDVTWVSVDLHGAISLRRRLLPSDLRNVLFEGSAFSDEWKATVDKKKPTVMLALGLLMYFPERQVTDFLQRLKADFAGHELIFDTVPRQIQKSTRFGGKVSDSYTTPPLKWGINLREFPRFFSGALGIEILSYSSMPKGHYKHVPLEWMASKIPYFRENVIPGLARVRL